MHLSKESEDSSGQTAEGNDHVGGRSSSADGSAGRGSGSRGTGTSSRGEDDGGVGVAGSRADGKSDGRISWNDDRCRNGWGDDWCAAGDWDSGGHDRRAGLNWNRGNSSGRRSLDLAVRDLSDGEDGRVLGNGDGAGDESEDDGGTHFDSGEGGLMWS